MDFQGQKLAEYLMTNLMLLFAAAGFVAGYIMQSFNLMCMVFAAGVLVTLLIVAPDWPIFNRCVWLYCR
jgi:signal peptidase complex subunit 1